MNPRRGAHRGRRPGVDRRALLGALVTGTLLGTGAPVAAQVAQVRPLVQSYTFDDPDAAGLESFRLVSVPWSVAVPLGSRMALSVGSAYASGRATAPDGQQATLSGSTDTDLGVSFALGDWLVMTADATLATGRSTLTFEESLVASFVAAELLPSPIATWGSGRSVGGSFAVATQAGAWGVGFLGGFRRAGSFEPLPGEPLVYDPGDQLQARLAFDRDVARSSTLSIVLGFDRHTSDRLQDANLYRSGNRMQALVSLAFPLGLRSSALFYSGVNHRSSGTLLVDESFLAGATDSPAQQLFITGTTLRVPLGRGSALLPRTELRVFRAEDGASQGWVGSAGTALDLRLAGNSASRRLVLSPSGQLRIGKVVVDEGSDAGFFGWEAGLALRVETNR